jgi:hypothetical protein
MSYELRAMSYEPIVYREKLGACGSSIPTLKSQTARF